MTSLLRDLFHHQEWADSVLLAAIAAHPEAAGDETLRQTLFHIVQVQRMFLALCAGRTFDRKAESPIPASFEDLGRLFRETHREEIALVEGLDEGGLSRPVEVPFFRGVAFSAEQGLLQAILHSQGHRAQCAVRFRALGGKPPTTDFILWAKDRPSPVW